MVSIYDGMARGDALTEARLTRAQAKAAGAAQILGGTMQRMPGDIIQQAAEARRAFEFDANKNLTIAAGKAQEAEDETLSEEARRARMEEYRRAQADAAISMQKAKEADELALGVAGNMLDASMAVPAEAHPPLASAISPLAQARKARSATPAPVLNPEQTVSEKDAGQQALAIREKLATKIRNDKAARDQEGWEELQVYEERKARAKEARERSEASAAENRAAIANTIRGALSSLFGDDEADKDAAMRAREERMSATRKDDAQRRRQQRIEEGRAKGTIAVPGMADTGVPLETVLEQARAAARDAGLGMHQRRDQRADDIRAGTTEGPLPPQVRTSPGVEATVVDEAQQIRTSPGVVATPVEEAPAPEIQATGVEIVDLVPEEQVIAEDAEQMSYVDPTQVQLALPGMANLGVTIDATSLTHPDPDGGPGPMQPWDYLENPEGRGESRDAIDDSIMGIDATATRQQPTNPRVERERFIRSKESVIRARTLEKMKASKEGAELIERLGEDYVKGQIASVRSAQGQARLAEEIAQFNFEKATNVEGRVEQKHELQMFGAKMDAYLSRIGFDVGAFGRLQSRDLRLLGSAIKMENARRRAARKGVSKTYVEGVRARMRDLDDYRSKTISIDREMAEIKEFIGKQQELYGKGARLERQVGSKRKRLEELEDLKRTFKGHTIAEMMNRSGLDRGDFFDALMKRGERFNLQYSEQGLSLLKKDLAGKRKSNTPTKFDLAVEGVDNPKDVKGPGVERTEYPSNGVIQQEIVEYTNRPGSRYSQLWNDALLITLTQLGATPSSVARPHRVTPDIMWRDVQGLKKAGGPKAERVFYQNWKRLKDKAVAEGAK